MAKKQALEQEVKRSLYKWGASLREPLVVGVSGGVDSMTLLTILVSLGFSPVAVHVNHGLRRMAKRDEDLVLAYSQKLKVPVVAKRVMLGSAKTGIEERARTARYSVLHQVALDVGAKYILTAHTADDQIETVVFNFFRGSSVRGLAGMRELTEDGVLRPLLAIRKSELIAYAKKHRIRHVEDETNKSKAFTRNRIRLSLLPELRSYNENIDKQILKTSELMAAAEQAIDGWAGVVFARLAKVDSGKVVITASKFRELTGFLQAEILKLSIVKLGGDLAGLTQAHFDEAARFVTNLTGKASSKKIGGKLWLQRGYDKITVSKK